MSVKLYFQVKKGNLTPLPEQLDAEHDYESIKWKFSPTTKKIPTIDLYQMLAIVNWETQEIIEIELELAFTDYISATKKEEIKQENLKYFQKLKKKIRQNILTKPSDLYISETTWELICASLTIGKYPLLIGPKGCGKTSTAQGLADATKRNFFPINCGAIFKPKQTLVGTVQAKDGSTFLVDSEFMKHFTSTEPTLIFLDELSRIPQSAANYFMTILDRKQSYLYVEEKGERIYKGPNVSFIAAANFGYEYTDTRNVDGALLDRFIKFLINYLPENEEVQLIQEKAPKANFSDIRSLVKLANQCRSKENLRVAVSTRQLIDMANYLETDFSINEIFDEIFVNLFYNGTMDERDTVKQMIDAQH